MKRTLKTTTLPDRLAKVVQQTSIAFLKRLPSYEDAKRGNSLDAAVSVALASIKNVKLSELANSLNDSKPLYLIPALCDSEDERSSNRLASGFAWVLKKLLELHPDRQAPITVYEEIHGVSARKNTGSSVRSRLLNEIRFTGLLPDSTAEYLICDDVFTFGGTIRALLEHLTEQSADVRGITVLGSGRYGRNLRPELSQVERLFVKNDLNDEILKEVTGYETAKFTGAELRGLEFALGGKGVERLREIFQGSSEKGQFGIAPDRREERLGDKGVSETSVRTDKAEAISRALDNWDLEF